jgi:3-oxoacyl-[acyl-carrier-protein] synthase II
VSTTNPFDRRVVITGLGTINPIGNNVEEFWDNLIVGKSAARIAQNMDLSNYHVRIAAEIDLPEDAAEYFKSKKMMRRLGRFITHSQIAGVQAIRDSGIDTEKIGHRCGVIIGTGDGGLQTHWDQMNRIVAKGMDTTSPFWVPGAIANSASAMLSQENNILGPSFAVGSACASGNHSIGIGVNFIQMGMADVMFVGGTEAVAIIPGMAAFGNIGALSRRNDDPKTASRPFDKDRDGFVMGEGAGILCIEELEHAKARGAKIYAEVSGFGFSSDAHDLVAPHPKGEGAARAIKLALQMAKLNADQLGLINCHGTSTPVGDKAESFAINLALGTDLATKIPVHSTKSMIGHLIGAAGGVEAIATIMAFERGVIHHTINQFEQDPEINLNVVKEPMEKKIDHAISDAFGFGGHNATVVLSRFKG